jgi:hypothetical protein
LKFEILLLSLSQIEHFKSPSGIWIRIASSVRGFFHGPLPNPGAPEAMRIQTLLIVTAT